MTLSNNQISVIGVTCLLILILIVFVPIIPDSSSTGSITIIEYFQTLDVSSDLPVNPDTGDEVGFCTLQFDPYCGTDGVTYGNLCQLELAEDIEIAFKGEC